jgi:hypothetical protein
LVKSWHAIPGLNASALAKITPLVNAALQRIAPRYMAGESADHLPLIGHANIEISVCGKNYAIDTTVGERFS